MARQQCRRAKIWQTVHGERPERWREHNRVYRNSLRGYLSRSVGLPNPASSLKPATLQNRIQSVCSTSARRRRYNPIALRVPRATTRGIPMRSRPARSSKFASSAVLSILFGLAACFAAPRAHAQERRDREPNSVYAERRAKLAAQVECPTRNPLPSPQESSKRKVEWHAHVRLRSRYRSPHRLRNCKTFRGNARRG